VLAEMSGVKNVWGQIFSIFNYDETLYPDLSRDPFQGKRKTEKI
jgi:hypothetical protein